MHFSLLRTGFKLPPPSIPACARSATSTLTAKIILLMLLQKVEWPQSASPQEPLRPWPKPSVSPSGSSRTAKSPPSRQIPHRAESGAQGRARSISHPEETWAAGGSPGPHPPTFRDFFNSMAISKDRVNITTKARVQTLICICHDM